MMIRSVGRHALDCVGLLLLVAAVGCNDPMPLVAVPGSSVVVPVWVDTGSIGFGGTDAPEDDPQRGSLYFRLVDENEQVVANVQARLTGVARPASRASYEGVGQIVSLFDVPATVAPGTYELKVVNVRGSQELSINSFELEIAELAQSPSRSPQATIPPFVEALLPQGFPKPAVVLNVGCSSCQVGSLDLEVTYPEDKIDLVDAVPGDALQKAIVWLEDDGEGTAQIGALTLKDWFGKSPITHAILLVFELEEGEDPLTTSMIGVTVKSAADPDGTPIPTSSVTVSAQGIL
jgi:hypothetical protein